MGGGDAAKAGAATPPRLYPGASAYPMLPVEECVAKVLQHTGPALEPVELPLDEAFGHLLSADVAADAPIPAFPTAIMDGFAVRSRDGPGRYPVDSLGGSTAGGDALGALAEGHVRYITTGARLPEGADAVVKVEDTKEVTESGSLQIDIAVSSSPGANVRKVGSDTPKGEVMLRRGARVGAGEIGVLAALGKASVSVHRRPRVAFLSTGDEVVDVATAASRDEGRGQVIDCNRPMLRALIAEAGAEAQDFGIVKDEPASVRERFAAALAAADVVVSSGGVSHGSRDHVKPLLAELGQVHFGSMCMKPGKPTTFATVPATGSGARPKLVFALPGNPVSCFVTFKLVVVPALQRLLGRPEGSACYPQVDAEIMGPIEMDPVRPEYHRAVARFDPASGRIVADSTGFQRSSRVASVAPANCLLEIPQRAGVLPKGTVVKALLLPSSGVAGGGLCPDPGGYPGPPADRGPPTAPPAAKAAPVVASQEKVECAFAIVAVGQAGASVAPALAERCSVEAADRVQALSSHCVRDVEPQSIQEAMDRACAELALTKRPALLLVPADLGLSERDAALAEAVRSRLEKDAPNVGDLVLRTALPRNPLAALAPLVAGYRDGCLVATLPAADGAAAADAAAALLRLVASGALGQPAASV